MLDQFEQVKEMAEQFATEGQTHAVICLEGSKVERLIFSKLIDMYKLATDVDYHMKTITFYEKNTRITA